MATELTLRLGHQLAAGFRWLSWTTALFGPAVPGRLHHVPRHVVCSRGLDRDSWNRPFTSANVVWGFLERQSPAARIEKGYVLADGDATNVKASPDGEDVGLGNGAPPAAELTNDAYQDPPGPQVKDRTQRRPAKVIVRIACSIRPTTLSSPTGKTGLRCPSCLPRLPSRSGGRNARSFGHSGWGKRFHWLDDGRSHSTAATMPSTSPDAQARATSST